MSNRYEEKDLGSQTITYKEINGQELKLVYVLPENHKIGKKTCILWIHGGGFCGGSAQTYLPHCFEVAKEDIAGFSVEYRLHSEKVSLLDCLSDVADAIVFIRNHGDEFGVDIDHIVAVGDSAGGYFAVALITIGYKLGYGKNTRPNAVVNCNGVVDLTGDFLPFVTTQFHDNQGNSDYLIKFAKEISPLYQLKNPIPPILHLQGKMDKTIPWQLTEKFHKRCCAIGGNSKLVLWEDAKHAFIVPNYTATEKQIKRAMKEIVSFVKLLP